MLLIGVLLSCAPVGATSIKTAETEISWDELNDVYDTDGTLAGDVADYMDINCTVWEVFAEVGVGVNVTFDADLITYLNGPAQATDNFINIGYYFPADFVNTGNATIILSILTNSPALCYTTIFYMNYADYLTFEWLTDGSDVYVCTMMSADNSSIEWFSDHQTIQTMVETDNWDLDGSVGEQICYYAFGGDGSFGASEYIDMWPEADEFGTGINPLEDGAAAKPDVFGEFSEAFYPSQTTPTTTSSTGGNGGTHHHASTTTSATTGVLPFGALPATWVFAILFFVVLAGSVMLLGSAPKGSYRRGKGARKH
jgi:hypothetical protein